MEVSPSDKIIVDKLEEDGSLTDSDSEGIPYDLPEEEGLSVFLSESEIEQVHSGKFDWDKFISDIKDHINSIYSVIGVKRARHE